MKTEIGQNYQPFLQEILVKIKETRLHYLSEIESEIIQTLTFFMDYFLIYILR